MAEIDDVRALLRRLKERLVAGEITREQYRQLIDEVTVGLAPSKRAELGLTPTPMPGGTPHPPGRTGTPRPLGPSGGRGGAIGTRLERVAEFKLQPGDVLLDKFKIVRELGRGGFGAVFEAEHLRLGRRCAVKVLDPAMVAKPDLLERFRREARAMQELAHPHIARVYDYDDRPEEGLALFAIEYLPGGSVGELQGRFKKAGRRVPVPLALAVLEQALDALAEAHKRGIIHRDVTPANLLLATDPEALLCDAAQSPDIKLIDFGIAGLAERKGHTLVGGGTVAWAAPEVQAGLEITAAADVFGAGAVAYFLLTGVPPQGRFEAPSEVREGVEAELSDFILKLLETDPDKRPTAREAASAVRSFASKCQTVDERPAVARTPGNPALVEGVPSPMQGNGGGRDRAPGLREPSPSSPPGAAPAEAGGAMTPRGKNLGVAALEGQRRPASRSKLPVALGAVVVVAIVGVVVIQNLRGRGVSPGTTVVVQPTATTSPVAVRTPSRTEERPTGVSASAPAEGSSGRQQDRKRPPEEKFPRHDTAVRLVNPGAGLPPGGRSIAVAIDVSGTSADAEDALVAKIASPLLTLRTGYFTRAFRTGGYLRRALAGDVAFLKDSGALTSTDYILVGHLGASFSKGSQVDPDLVSCRLQFTYRLIDRSGRTVASDSVTITGAGFSDEDARSRALEMLAEQYRAKILGPAA